MNIIEPNVELWSEENVTPEEHIARCARVCYGNEGVGKNPKRLVEALVKNKHLSMLRHASKYFFYYDFNPDDLQEQMTLCPYNTVCNGKYAETFWLSTNFQEYKFGEDFIYDGDPKSVRELKDVLELCSTLPHLFEIVRLTFCITTQISTSRELNRVSPNNIAERSTRYCSSKDGIDICRPHWWNGNTEDRGELKRQYVAKESWQRSEDCYKALIQDGMKPQDARGVLPLDTATKVVYTYSVREWKHILSLRYYGTTGVPHPNAKLVMGMVRDQINDFARNHGIDYQV